MAPLIPWRRYRRSAATPDTVEALNQRIQEQRLQRRKRSLVLSPVVLQPIPRATAVSPYHAPLPSAHTTANAHTMHHYQCPYHAPLPMPIPRTTAVAFSAVESSQLAPESAAHPNTVAYMYACVYIARMSAAITDMDRIVTSAVLYVYTLPCTAQWRCARVARHHDSPPSCLRRQSQWNGGARACVCSRPKWPRVVVSALRRL